MGCRGNATVLIVKSGFYLENTLAKELMRVFGLPMVAGNMDVHIGLNELRSFHLGFQNQYIFFS